jgi:hypothetical protein
VRETGRWELTLEDVPTNSRQVIKVNDPNACTENSTGYVLRNTFANDVPLSNVVPGTPGATGFDADPGFSFAVDGSGRVTP